MGLQFLLDFPEDGKTALGLSPIGVQLVERDGVWHILDWIGSEHYPNVADFLEEVRRFGLSRRLAKTVDFSKLTERSKILVGFVHGTPFMTPAYLAPSPGSALSSWYPSTCTQCSIAGLPGPTPGTPAPT